MKLRDNPTVINGLIICLVANLLNLLNIFFEMELWFKRMNAIIAMVGFFFLLKGYYEYRQLRRKQEKH